MITMYKNTLLLKTNITKEMFDELLIEKWGWENHWAECYYVLYIVKGEGKEKSYLVWVGGPIFVWFEEREVLYECAGSY